MSRIGSEISRLRKEKGLNQKQLAKLAGVSEGFIDEVESGKRVVNNDLAVRITKILGQQDSQYDFYAIEEKTPDKPQDKVAAKAPPKAAQPPIQDFWQDALGNVIKLVPIYDYKMDKALESRHLPIIANKVEGYPKDKVFYLQIADQDMIGFRMAKNDLALAYMTHEVERDAICLIEYQGKRVIRQIKRLDGEKLLLVSNSGTLATETAETKSVKVLARLFRLEINL